MTSYLDLLLNKQSDTQIMLEAMIRHIHGNRFLVQPLFSSFHGDVIKWKHFLRYWSFVRGIHRSPGNSPHNGQWRGALMFSLICAWINGWVNNREAGDLRRYHAHYDVIVMHCLICYNLNVNWSGINFMKLIIDLHFTLISVNIQFFNRFWGHFM